MVKAFPILTFLTLTNDAGGVVVLT